MIKLSAQVKAFLLEQAWCLATTNNHVDPSQFFEHVCSSAVVSEESFLLDKFLTVRLRKYGNEHICILDRRGPSLSHFKMLILKKVLRDVFAVQTKLQSAFNCMRIALFLERTYVSKMFFVGLQTEKEHVLLPM